MVGKRFSDLFRSQDWSLCAAERNPVAFLALGGVNHIKTDFTHAFLFIFLLLNGECVKLYAVSCHRCNFFNFLRNSSMIQHPALPGCDATSDITTSQAFLPSKEVSSVVTHGRCPGLCYFEITD